jgi:hypothetical protein
MERVLAKIVFPCKYKCGVTESSWYRNKEHEMDCLYGPDICPANACSLKAPKAALVEHMSTVHKWPMTRFRYGVPFDIPAVPGYRLLRGEDDDVHIFVLVVSDSVDNGQHSVYIQPVGECDKKYDFGCSVSVTWPESSGRYQHRSGSCDDIVLMDPEDRLCIFPGRRNLVLKTIMYKKAG